MYRTVFLISFFMALICLMGLVLPRTLSDLIFLFPSGIYALACLLLAMVPLHFSLFTYFRRSFLKRLLGMVGVLLIIVAILGFISPTYFGLFYAFQRVTNIMSVLLTGVAYLIACLEEPRESVGALITDSYRQRHSGTKVIRGHTAHSHK